MKKLKLVKEIEVPEFKFIYEVVKVDTRDWGIEDGVLLIKFDDSQGLILTKAMEEGQMDCILLAEYNKKRKIWVDIGSNFVNINK